MIFIIISIILLVILLRTLQIAYFSPLSSFPNAHFLAPLTPLWLLWVKATKREIRLRTALHEKYGPVVRLGPSELSINDAKGIKLVYGGGFEKNDFFQAFVNYGQDVMFSTIDPKAHTERKRMLSHLYSKSYIQTSPQLSHLLSTLTTSIKFEISCYTKENKAFDVYKLTKAFGMDTTTGYLFGEGYGTNFIQDCREGDPFVPWEVGLSPEALFWNAQAPKLRKVIESLGLKVLDSKFETSWSEVEKVCFNLCSKAQSNFQEKGADGPIDEEKGEINSYPNTVYAQLYRKISDSYQGEIPKDLLDRKAAAEMLDHMLAGNEGAGITLTYLTLHLATQPEILRLLQTELSWNPNPSPQEIDNLPVVDAVLQETLRLHPAAFGPFPRVVPAKGAEINGISIPKGTQVSTSAYSLHRNGGVFPQPEEWKPERWLGKGEEERREMMRWSWAFGSGGRMCIGNHLAVRMMKAFIVAVYSEFESYGAENGIPEQVPGIMGIPQGNQVFVKFRKIE